MTAPFDRPLQVDPAHLSELADKHRDAEHLIGLASALIAGDAEKLARTHGVVCEPAASAARAAELARQEACIAMQAMSDTFAENLEHASLKFVETDEGGAGAIDEFHRRVP